jgi:trehalose 6-phosphate synthase/phosphatase
MRLIVVSNRLPVTVDSSHGKIKFKQSAGGLVQGLSASLDSLQDFKEESHYIWVGWPGTTIKKEFENKIKEDLLNDLGAYPVFMDASEMSKFYLGFCNSTLWPLFHTLPSFVTYSEDYFEEYIKVNEKFFNSLQHIIEPDDIVWIHDYHLMMLPNLIRKKYPKMPVGFFLHIPFPPYEVFSFMPKRWRNFIIEGLLGADIIGFHTFNYMQNFLKTLSRNSGIQNKFGKIVLNNRIVKAGVFPIGINFERYNKATEREAVKKEVNDFKSFLGERKIILSIDRLDYSKGIVSRLKSYERFLEKNPAWHKKTSLVMIVVPSRIGVYQYQKTKNRIDQLVGSINGKYGSIGWSPIIYQFRNLPFDSLSALYSIGDMILVTPVMDGMNLVSKEFLAVHKDHKGVLILSECAGSAEELENAIIVSPNDTIEIANAIEKVLNMNDQEKIRMNLPMEKYLKKYNIKWWADQFIKELLRIHKSKVKVHTIKLSKDIKAKISRDLKRAKKRLFLLDYDGTLVPFVKDPKSAKPSEKLIYTLKKLSENKLNKVVILSGRDKNTLDSWFSGFKIDIFAEHGVYYKKVQEKWKLFRNLDTAWKKEVLQILKMYQDRLPYSFVEEKDYSLVFNFRASDERLASSVIPELFEILSNFTQNTGLVVLNVSKGLEVKDASINKGFVALYYLEEPFQFIFAAGDDSIDEDMFKVLPKNIYSIKVGEGITHARYKVKNSDEILELLKEVSEI